MRAFLAALLAAFLIVTPVVAAPAPKPESSISIVNPSPSYVVGQEIELAVTWGKLKGYEYPVVLQWCGYMTEPGYEDVKNWTYFRRWDTKGYDYPRSTGPEPVRLSTAGECTFELWAYTGLTPGHYEHVIIVGPMITIAP